MRLSFDVVGTPAPQGSKRGFVNRHTGKVSMVESSSERVRSWRSDVRDAAEKAVADDGWPLERGPVAVTVVFRIGRPKGHYGTGRNADVLKASAPPFPAKKPDLDKLARATLDALTGIVFADDEQVVTLRVRKVWVAGRAIRPGALIDVDRLVDPAEGAP